MARDTGATVIVPIYPLVTPEEGGNAATVVPPMADFIADQVEAHGAENVSVYGDSAGGTLAMLAVQKIVRDCGGNAECVQTRVPPRMVLLSPSLGGTSIYTDPNFVLVDDPVTSIPRPGDPGLAGRLARWRSALGPDGGVSRGTSADRDLPRNQRHPDTRCVAFRQEDG